MADVRGDGARPEAVEVKGGGGAESGHGNGCQCTPLRSKQSDEFFGRQVSLTE